MKTERKKHPTNCVNCSSEFLAYKKGKATRKYCSDSCRKSHTSKIKTYKCESCGSDVKRTPGNIRSKIYCSKECSDKGKIGVSINKKQLVEITCLNCKQTKTYRPHEKNKRLTCSVKCSDELKSKRSTVKVKCEQCGKIVTRVLSRAKRGNFAVCSNSCLAEYLKENMINNGENHPNFKGGSNKYYGPEWRQAKRIAKKRDLHICKKCGITEKDSLNKYKESLSVHHIKPFILFDTSAEANKLDNLITICKSCHAKEHSGDLHYTNYMK